MPDTRARHDADERLRHHVRYRFDNLLSKGTWAALLWLGAITFVAVILSSMMLLIAGVTFTGDEGASWVEDLWQSLLRVMDPGTMAGDVGWGRRLLALVITIFGLLVAGTLIGILATGVEDRIERMRRGRSAVIEEDHVVVLGPAGRLAPVVRELIRNGHGRHGGIVAMGDDDPAAMRDAVRRLAEVPRATRLVFRCGDPTRLDDLGLVRAHRARAVVVVGDEDDGPAVRTVLAVAAELGPGSSVPIVVELSSSERGKALVYALGARVHPLVTEQAVARVAALAVQRPGVAEVVESLLDPGRANVVVVDAPVVHDLPFGAVVRRATGARPIGRMRADGSVELNPSAETVVEPGDRLVLVAERPERFGLRQEPDLPARVESRPATAPSSTTQPEHLLVVGWSRIGTLLLDDWASTAPAGSTIKIAAPPDAVPAADLASLRSRVAVRFAPRPATLISRPAQAPGFSTLVVLSHGPADQPSDADGATILTLMGLRRRVDERPGPAPRVVVELLDPESVPLLPSMGPDDHLLTRSLGAQMLAQLADQPERRAVFLALYTAASPTIRLVPVTALGLLGERDFAEVASASDAAHVLAIGWRHAGEIVLDPPATARATLRPDDSIIAVG